MGSWYSKGYDDAEAQTSANSSGWVRDFFLKNGEEANGVRILDEDSFNIRAHFVKGKGWFTCINGIDDDGCPLCEAGNKSQNQFVFNVIDPREYTSPKGETYVDQVKLWRVGITLLRLLNKRRNTYGPYPFLEIDVSKMGAGAWDIVAKKVDKEYKLKDDQETHNLEEVLAPKTRKELVAILNNSEVETPTTSSDDDDDEEFDWRKG